MSQASRSSRSRGQQTARGRSRGGSWRAVVFVAFALFIVLGPFYRQVLRGRNPAIRNWVMFNGKATGFIDARFFVRESGHDIEIDRFAVLGMEKKRGNRYWLIKNEQIFESVKRQLCRRTGQDVRVEARISTRRGWRDFADREESACAPK